VVNLVPRPRYHKITRPSPKVDKFLGSLETVIMEHFWAGGTGTVRDVVDYLGSERAPAYTTVMTVMTRLADKGLLARDLVGNTYHYRAAQSRERFLGDVSRQIVDDLLADFGDVAIAQFLTRIEQVAPEKLAALLKLARENKEGSGER
jgi:predicted transcriptional regulator